jgi:hypothetical protein
MIFYIFQTFLINFFVCFPSQIYCTQVSIYRTSFCINFHQNEIIFSISFIINFRKKSPGIYTQTFLYILYSKYSFFTSYHYIIIIFYISRKDIIKSRYCFFIVISNLFQYRSHNYTPIVFSTIHNLKSNP